MSDECPGRLLVFSSTHLGVRAREAGEGAGEGAVSQDGNTPMASRVSMWLPVAAQPFRWGVCSHRLQLCISRALARKAHTLA